MLKDAKNALILPEMGPSKPPIYRWLKLPLGHHAKLDEGQGECRRQHRHQLLQVTVFTCLNCINNHFMDFDIRCFRQDVKFTIWIKKGFDGHLILFSKGSHSKKSFKTFLKSRISRGFGAMVELNIKWFVLELLSGHVTDVNQMHHYLVRGLAKIAPKPMGFGGMGYVIMGYSVQIQPNPCPLNVPINAVREPHSG